MIEKCLWSHSAHVEKGLSSRAFYRSVDRIDQPNDPVVFINRSVVRFSAFLYIHQMLLWQPQINLTTALPPPDDP
jgi:hypothetical protein